MEKTKRTYIVMGLLDEKSISYAIGRTLAAQGARVIYTVQNEVLKKRYMDKSKTWPEEERSGIECLFCDVTSAEQVEGVFDGIDDLAGVVHSLAYANPSTCLGESFSGDAMADVLKSYQVSCASLAVVVEKAAPAMPDGGSVVALTFDSTHAHPYYNWMGVHKAGLEALVRGLARSYGKSRIRVNAVSAGPLRTSASSRVPHFDRLIEAWQAQSPLKWDADADKQAVADAVAFLVGSGSEKITGQVLTVDGGASMAGAPLEDFER